MPTPTLRVVARWTVLVLAAAAAYRLLAHRSDEPFILGYSLFYIVCLFSFAGALAFAVALFRRFGSSAWYAIAAIAILVSTIAAAAEIIAQLYALRNPAYEVLYLQPDRVTGWKGVPNLRFTWAGPHWAAFEFSVPTILNSSGFHDLERTVEKPPHVARVALLGDSFVEALQVSFDKTAGQLLERSLNSTAGAQSVQEPRYEVLNFGVSAYGLGQYLLAWEKYARSYKPDYVFAYVAKFHMERTLSRGGMETQGSHDLWTRPTYTLRSNELVLVPAGEYDKFVAAQERLIRDELGGTRILKRRGFLFLGIMLGDVNTTVTRVQRRFTGVGAVRDRSEEELAINLRILEELAASVHRSGARLIIADSVRYHRGSQELSDTLKEFCARKDIGYVNVSDDLLKKEDAGISTKRAYDGHFNELGNQIFAAAMYRWMASSAAPPR